MTPAVYCTCFDHRYLPRGVAMIRSLRRFAPDAQVWVVCLSDAAHQALVAMAEPGVQAVCLAEFENGDAALLRAKQDGRSLIEYYFTLTPSLIRYTLAKKAPRRLSPTSTRISIFSLRPCQSMRKWPMRQS